VWELLRMPGTERDIAFSQLAMKGLIRERNCGQKNRDFTVLFETRFPIILFASSTNSFAILWG
jgi:hypothetical protein